MAKRVGWCAAVMIWALVIASCKGKGPGGGALDPGEQALMMAIASHGGLKQLQAASAYSGRIERTQPGIKLTGTMRRKGGAVRVEYVAQPSGNPVVEVAADGRCWQRRGRAVLPCTPERSAHTTRLAQLQQASWLWPLAKQPDRKLRVEKIELGGAALHALAVPDGSGAKIGSLLLDPNSYLVVGLEMQTKLGGKQGQLVGTFSKFEQHCGIKIATQHDYTFAGKPLATDKISGVFCEPVDDETFDQSAQVADKLVEIRHTYDTPLACTKLEGPYSGVRQAMDKVVDFVAQKGLQPEGAAILIHHKGPPKVSQPARFVTDVCFPISKKAWLMPKSEWRGEYSLEQIVGDEVLAAFGIGDIDRNAAELAKALLEAARKQGRKQAGPMRQIVYMRPGDFPPEQQVSEMHLPLE